ncbi:10653_t:CDS:2 [Funneliformis geosporum]|uniref:13996_t:CDS:1 n=1 Tax=Funneliformis geosporum TaxID=1117311 RepID=A0A9W4WSE7_9GLOM|nr:13996_t:CDS:2 [Funneliformis geosporum]CAI2190900.1 10653_t:CDS:2 [Funneliformis geosporum]
MTKLSTIGKLTLISVILYAIILTILEILVIYFHHNFVNQFVLDSQGKGISEADLIYHSIFILSLVFQVLLCIDALRRRNTIQLIALVIFNLTSLAYAGVQLYQHIILEDEGTDNALFAPMDINKYPTRIDAKKYFQTRMRPLEFLIIVIVALFSLYLAGLVFKLSKQFGWENYRTYSADVEVRNAFVSLSILQTLIKLDVFFIGAYAIQLIPSRSIGYSEKLIETVLIFVIGAIMLLMAWYSVTKESKYILLSVVNLLILSLVYMGYRIIIINLPIKNERDPYLFTRRLLTFFLATTICLVIGTVYYASVSFRNMMRGVYVFSVYGLPGREEQHVSEINPGNDFNTEYLGYDAYSGYSGYRVDDSIDESKRKSKRASKIAEVAQNNRISRRLSID